jgi:hypothetical protein
MMAGDEAPGGAAFSRTRKGSWPLDRAQLAGRAARASVVALAGLCSAAATGHAADPVARDIAAAAGLSFQDGRLGLTQGETPVFDYDRDGQRDILLSTHNVSPWRLMRNKGNGTFAEVLAGTFARTDRHGCIARDLGSLGGSGRPDGRPDLYCVTGACQGRCEREYPNSLFIQSGDGTFCEVAAAWGVDDPHGRGREAVALDYDKDGLLDLAVANQVRPSSRPRTGCSGTSAADSGR